jgi:hypothetical protein
MEISGSSYRAILWAFSATSHGLFQHPRQRQLFFYMVCVHNKYSDDYIIFLNYPSLPGQKDDNEETRKTFPGKRKKGKAWRGGSGL